MFYQELFKTVPGISWRRLLGHSFQRRLSLEAYDHHAYCAPEKNQQYRDYQISL
jgi:hypothetical protein